MIHNNKLLQKLPFHMSKKSDKGNFFVVYILANNCTLLCFSLNHLLKIFSLITKNHIYIYIWFLLITKILQSFFFNKKYLPKIKSLKKFFASEKILVSKI
jgi:hypothetical protein